MSRTYTLTLVPGDDEYRSFNTAVDFTGYTDATAYVLCAEDLTAYAAQCNITDPASAGVVAAEWTAAQTEEISRHFRWGALWWVRALDPDGRANTVLHGRVALDVE